MRHFCSCATSRLSGISRDVVRHGTECGMPRSGPHKRSDKRSGSRRQSSTLTYLKLEASASSSVWFIHAKRFSLWRCASSGVSSVARRERTKEGKTCSYKDWREWDNHTGISHWSVQCEIPHRGNENENKTQCMWHITRDRWHTLGDGVQHHVNQIIALKNKKDKSHGK